MTAGTRQDERGSVAPFAVACLGVLVLLTAALGVVAALIHAQRQAQAAADLAALSGARALADGGDGCGEGGRIAHANHAQVLACSVQGREIRLRVEVPGPHWLGQTADLTAEARAGPG